MPGHGSAAAACRPSTYRGKQRKHYSVHIQTRHKAGCIALTHQPCVLQLAHNAHINNNSVSNTPANSTGRPTTWPDTQVDTSCASTGHCHSVCHSPGSLQLRQNARIMLLLQNWPSFHIWTQQINSSSLFLDKAGIRSLSALRMHVLMLQRALTSNIVTRALHSSSQHTRDLACIILKCL
jgi:hypothetical protein